MAKQVYSGSSASTTESTASGTKGKSGQTRRRSRLHDEDGWGGFGGYANAKMQKLNEQFNQGKTTRENRIFAGVAVYVNGYTNPSSDELRRILQRNGGHYEVYLSKTRVTHIVATNLPNSKYRLAKTIPVVRPEWITDSEAAGKRLSHVPYLLLSNKSKLQPGLKNLAHVSAAAETYLKLETKPSAHDFVKGERGNSEVKAAGQDVNCDIKFIPERVFTNISSEVKNAKMEECFEIVETVSHQEQKLNVNDRISIMNDEDDNDVVYNSEEENNNEKDKSRLTVPLLSENEVSPHKKRSRVYSFRKFRKSDSGSFDAHGLDSCSSCDGFIEDVKSGLADCGEDFSQNIDTPLLAARVNYSNNDISSDCVWLQGHFNDTEMINTVEDKSSTSCLSHASAGALETLQPVCSQVDHDDGLGLQTGWLSQKTGSAQTEVLNMSDVSSTAASVIQVHGDTPAKSSVAEPKISHISPDSTSQQVPYTSELSLSALEPTYPFVKQTTSSSSSAILTVPALDQTSLSSRQSSHKSSATLPDSALEPAHLSLVQTSHRRSATSSASALEPAHLSVVQTSHRPSAASSALTLEPAHLSLVQTSYRLSAASSISTLEPAHVSLVQSPHRPSATSVSVLEPAHPSSKHTSQRPGQMAKTGDKNFLSEFYANSRLHHIATWGAEFKAYVSEIQKSNSHSFPGREKLRQLHVENALKLGHSETLSSARHGGVQKTVMHIDMDCFFVSVGLLARPDLKGKPVAVTHSRGQGAKPNPDSNVTWEMDEWMKKRSSVHLKGTRTKAVGHMDTDDTETADDPAGENDAASGASGITPTFQSLSEIASCSYQARQAGVKNGMFMGTALKLCPGIQTIPYNFSEYNRVSRILYDVVASYTHDIEAVSCDEMLIDCTDVLSDTGASAMEFAQVLRAEILEKTGCSSSAGIGPNILLARLATRRAKPDGQFEVSTAEAKDFIKDQPVSDLPGVGYSMCRKLTLLEVHTCGDLQKLALSTLKQEFGPKTGEMLHRFCMGQDSREIKGDKQRKSVSAEVNYGIRFLKESEAVTFLQDLSSEVKRRMDAIGVKGRSITLKLMVRRPDAPVETAKFMGHGICNTFNKSSNLPVATNDEKVIAREVVSLYRAHRVAASDVRGIGIHINKLERTATAKGVPSGARGSGYQDITNFTVQKTSNTTTTTDSAVTTTATSTTSTKCVATTCSTFVPISSSVTSPSRSTAPFCQSYTSLRSCRRELLADLQPRKCNANNIDSTISSESPVKYPRVTTPAQNYSVHSKCNIGPQFLSETGSTFYKTKLISGANINSENFNSAVHEQNASLQKTNSPQNSKLLTVNFDSKFCIPGPSWQVDVSESGMNQDERFDGNASFLSESQIDSDVLHELPAEIADEILEDLRVRKQRKQTLSAVTPASNPVHTPNSRNGTLLEQGSDRCAEGAVFHGGLPSLSQLDLSCFHALPLHLQDELRAEYARQEVTSQRSADKKAGLAERNLTQLRSPPKNSRHKQSNAGLKNPKQSSRRGRQPGKRTLNFGNSKVKSGSRDRDHQTDEKRRPPYLDCGIVICIDNDDDDTSSSRDICANEDSSDRQNLLGVLHRACSSDVPADCLRPAANVRQDRAEDRLENVTFCGADSLDDVRKLMKEWMISCTEPQADDVSMVTEYLIRLVQRRNLEQVFCLLRFLTRSLSQSSARWKESLFNITTCVQNVVCACYGATFKL